MYYQHNMILWKTVETQDIQRTTIINFYPCMVSRFFFPKCSTVESCEDQKLKCAFKKDSTPCNLYVDYTVIQVMSSSTFEWHCLWQVMAEDSGLSPLSDRTEVEISIVDVNDNSPRFSSVHYHGSVHENVPAGSSILEVSAHDEDERENGKVRYRFVGKNQDEQSFTVDPVVSCYTLICSVPSHLYMFSH